MLRLLSLASLTIGAVFVASAAAPSAQDARPANAPASAPRTVVITGANRGLGLEFARQYQQAGWNVIGTAREPGEATDLNALKVRVEQLDVASADSVAALAAKLKGQSVDLLINNAGVSGGARRLEELKMEDLEHIMNVNAYGPVRVTQALLPNLRTGAGKTVVSISSGLGSITQNTRGGNYAYRQSKASLNMFMRTLAAELKGEGFVCIPMSPGWVQTDMGGPNAQLTPEQSITGMRKVIDNLKPEDSGKFWNHDGSEVPW